MIRNILIFITFSKAIASMTNLTHSCKAQPGGLVETYKSNCKWVLNWIDGIPNDSCQFENVGNHTDVEKYNYMREWEDKCCASGLCPGQRLAIANYEVLNGYGCWCSASTHFAYGRGRTMDELDVICKNLVENYRCIKYDTAKENGDCPPEFNDYHVSFSIFLETTADELYGKCAQIQSDDHSDERRVCAIRRCQVDFTVLKFMMQSFTSNYRPDANLKWTQFGGSFDPATECFNEVPGQEERTKTCCGEYPHRLPLNANKTGCCSGVRYGLESQECCLSGTAQEVTEMDTCAGTTVPWVYEP